MTGRVGVNLLWLRPGQVGGTETYLTRLLRAIASMPDPGIEVHLFGLPSFPEAHPDLVAAFPTHVAPLPSPARPVRVAAEATWLAGAAARRGLALLHHAGGTVPPVRTVPAVVTIHDLQYLTFPETFSTVKLLFLSRMVPQAVRRARIVTTTSEYVRGRVIEALAVPEDRVMVVPPVASEAPVEPREVAAVAARLGIDGLYFIYPTAAPYPFKNHAVLVEALASVPDVTLVLTGEAWPPDSDPAGRARRLGVSDRIRHTGYVEAADLDALYRGAVATVFPSRYEGFGMGALEAMTRGCPVIAAATTALPETVGDGGLLVEADDAVAWAGAMSRLLSDHDLRRSLGRAAAARAATFTPERGAAAQLAAYRRAWEVGPRP